MLGATVFRGPFQWLSIFLLVLLSRHRKSLHSNHLSYMDLCILWWWMGRSWVRKIVTVFEWRAWLDLGKGRCFWSVQVKQSSTVGFNGCELHSVNRAAHLGSPSISIIAYTIRAASFGESGNWPILPVFPAPVIFPKWWLVWLRYTLIHDQP